MYRPTLGVGPPPEVAPGRFRRAAGHHATKQDHERSRL